MSFLHPEKMRELQGLLHSQGLSFHNLKDQRSAYMLHHFCDIMSWGIKKVIDFCKGIPQFSALSLPDQVFLLKGGCLEMLVIRSYSAFSQDGSSYRSEKFQYTQSDFIKAGASRDFVRAYNSVHCRMRELQVTGEEICLLLALVLFSPDRDDLTMCEEVERAQNQVAETLQALQHAEKAQERAVGDFCEIMLLLPKLRTVSSLFSRDIDLLQRDFESDVNPLVFEFNN